LSDRERDVRYGILMAFVDIGADASNAVASIVEVLVPTTGSLITNSDFKLRSAAALALGRIGPPASNALPALTATLQESDSDLRRQAALAIWRIAEDVDTALPVLLSEMPARSDPAKRQWIINLGEMGPRAKQALPQLQRELEEDNDIWILQEVTNALRKIEPDNVEKTSPK